MTPEELWTRYAAIWSVPDAEERAAELAVCLTEDATYCDPNGLLVGRSALSDYMGRFQAGVAGGRFHIRAVLHHHDRSIANWSLHGADGGVLQTGTSFGALADGGRLQMIVGFFYPPGRDEAV
jgi:hypothetical protein